MPQDFIVRSMKNLITLLCRVVKVNMKTNMAVTLCKTAVLTFIVVIIAIMTTCWECRIEISL